MKEALYYEKQTDNSVRCLLCPNFCRIAEGKSGSCRSRKNIKGTLYAINYGRTTSLSLDPIEKKPLYHYYPGSQILSLGANSCNLHCEFCQNYEISQAECPTSALSPSELLQIMQEKNLKQVAFTYTEPFTWYEFILDCAKLFQPHDIKIVLVTNGYINPEPLAELLPSIDAMNIDLKSINADFYKKICHGNLKPILETIKTAFASCHIELTNLLIPGLNDKENEIQTLIDFVAEVNLNIPLNFSKYFPRWKCKQPATSDVALISAYKLAKEKLSYVYIGNMQTDKYSNTSCPNCNKLLIDRSRNSVRSVGFQSCISSISALPFDKLRVTHCSTTDKFKQNICDSCGFEIYGRFDG
jgi:pyruvate formate lyase activating enzyme